MVDAADYAKRERKRAVDEPLQGERGGEVGLDSLFDFFFPAPSLSTTSSLQTTRWRCRATPRRRRVPTVWPSEPSSSRGWLSCTMIVRDPSEGAEAFGRRACLVDIVTTYPYSNEMVGVVRGRAVGGE